MVLVHIDAFQFQRLAIEQETLLGIKPDITDANSRRIDISHLVIHLHDVFHLIEIRIVRTPQMRFLDNQHTFLTFCVLGLQIAGIIILTIHHLASLSIE